ncbi:unnamed protein product [Ambrosiozyma monospora]|uniref:Unnamed protein product n=1 Tax=Ambrosiozyma monospora TaxID=43982 RepID=A0ACB5T6S8_AMBMO|nr:unnamed protein product [Ambrosiozyma monospora]
MKNQTLKNIWNPHLFKSKVCFITGGSGTICSKQAEGLIKLGCSVSIIGRNEQKVNETVKRLILVSNETITTEEKIKVIGIPNIDVRDPSSLNKAVSTTVDKLGRIDFVIAGAAGNFISDFNHMSSNAFKSVVDIDLLGTFNTVKACYDQLVLNKGSVIFVSATLHYYGVPFQCHVGAAKAGVDALCRSLAVELGTVGIRVNAIAPGAIEGTEGFARLAVADGETGGKSPVERFTEKIPLQRLGSVTDISNATIFLFSDAASYITGTVMIVDGGFWHMGNFNSYPLYPGVLKNRLLDKKQPLRPKI